ncbi:fructose-specific PTS transporter subunit EIIC [Borrelia hermsii]|uniref:protein-N(pi)-phosphohistidine--D-fructose phosphotransferase n=3 Tax=Borrelia hermsii TaxID=140 RepID=A0AA34WDE6_BORHD|nr:fructose-specific PTS transporter subunit EIIC [Borrelia hermsii]AAX16916.1 PTS system, mannose-specific IIABC component [Borrelia hermsii DAH]UCP01422.1 fructose-specific PTS transporter subunit EIIC [Borrelia hermsii]UEQ07049.1 fructose-specific PTS transporter subunit EIIC [Borrelia hermsii]UPA07730.1 PTS sugar transporter subunit IIA [Borrelia hermsii DAH]
MFLNYLKKELIFVSNEISSKAEAINFLVDQVSKRGYTHDRARFLQGLLDRENIGDTSWENGVAIPHFIGDVVSSSFISLLYIKGDGIKWSDDNPPVNLIFLICMSKSQQGGAHIKSIAFIAKLFENDDFKNMLKVINSPDEIYSYIENVDKTFTDDTSNASKLEKVVAVCACPVGVAHTYIAAKKLEVEVKRQGYNIKVETQGSIGIDNPLTETDIKDADVVILAVDKDIDEERFDGKRVYKVSTAKTINNVGNVIKEAFSAPVLHYKNIHTLKDKSGKGKSGFYKYLMSGVSPMVPIVASGGILIALGISFAGIGSDGPNFDEYPFYKTITDIGAVAFGMMLPVLSGFIAMAIADKPGLAPGLVGGVLARDVKAGFLGAILVGFMAGFVARWIARRKIPEWLRPVMPIFVIPLISTVIIGLFMIYGGIYIGQFMELLENGLKSLQNNSETYGIVGKLFLGLILGAMVAIDMGGPFNKVAFLFGVGMIPQVPQIMGMVASAIPVPPMAMGLATLLMPKLFEEEERESGKISFLISFIGISEGAIPFAASDPARVLPSIVLGGAVASIIAAFLGVADHAPHGGPIVLPVVDNKLGFIIAIAVGVAVATSLVIFLKSLKVKASK